MRRKELGLIGYGLRIRGVERLLLDLEIFLDSLERNEPTLPRGRCEEGFQFGLEDPWIQLCSDSDNALQDDFLEKELLACSVRDLCLERAKQEVGENDTIEG